MQEVKFEQSWNKKRILIALLILLALLGAGYFLTGSIFTKLVPKKSAPSYKNEKSKESVLSSESTPNLSEAVQKQIESIKKEVNKINIDEIASSSSQIQKIINDVKSLEKLPQSQVKDACLKICGGL